MGDISSIFLLPGHLSSQCFSSFHHTHTPLCLACLPDGSPVWPSLSLLYNLSLHGSGLQASGRGRHALPLLPPPHEACLTNRHMAWRHAWHGLCDNTAHVYGSDICSLGRLRPGLTASPSLGAGWKGHTWPLEDRNCWPGQEKANLPTIFHYFITCPDPPPLLSSLKSSSCFSASPNLLYVSLFSRRPFWHACMHTIWLGDCFCTALHCHFWVGGVWRSLWKSWPSD